MTAGTVAKRRQEGAEARIDAAVQSALDQWPDPLTAEPPEIEAELLPGWLGEFVAELARSTQTPPSMAVAFALSVAASCVQGRYLVAPLGANHDYREALPIWSLTVVPSGGRKSAVARALLQPLQRREKRERDRLRGEIARVRTDIETREARIKALQMRFGKCDDAAERNRLRDEIEAERKGMPDPIYPLRLYTSDVTVERLQAMLVEQRGRVAVLSDEAGQFSTLTATYSGGSGPALDVALQGFSGDASRTERAGREAYIDRATVTLGLMAQNDLLRDAAGNARFRASGLMARFLYAVPGQFVGRRNVRDYSSIPPAVREAYTRGIDGLLTRGLGGESGAVVVVALDDAARESYLDFAQRVEGWLAPGGALAAVSDWGAKLPGNAARIALLFELIGTPDGTDPQHVSHESMEQAVALCERLIVHARVAFRLLGADQVDRDADAVLDWVKFGKRKDARGFAQSEAHKAMHGRFKTVERLAMALQRLSGDGCLRYEQRKNKRARATDYWHVNPKLFIH